MEQKTLSVNLEQSLVSYPIHIGKSLTSTIASDLSKLVGGSALHIIIDQVCANDWLVQLEKELGTYRLSYCVHPILDVTESLKSLEYTERLVRRLFDHKVQRSDILVAVGGGVVGDLVGFVASILFRGMRFIQVPTTLLAQIDSSIGGKTAINMNFGKNLLGSFYHPVAVYIDSDWLKTLPTRQFLSGMVELIKYGLIDDISLLMWLKKNKKKLLEQDPTIMAEAIQFGLEHKLSIIQADEKEQYGKRVLLNLGHTFAHACEQCVGYDGTLLHGEAVALGILFEYSLSERLGICKVGVFNEIKKLFASMGIKTHLSDYTKLSLNKHELQEVMYRDKKNHDHLLTFILSRTIGDTYEAQVSDQQALDYAYARLGIKI